MRDKVVRLTMAGMILLAGCATYFFSGALMLEIAISSSKDPPAFSDYGVLLFPMMMGVTLIVIGTSIGMPRSGHT